MKSLQALISFLALLAVFSAIFAHAQTNTTEAMTTTVEPTTTAMMTTTTTTAMAPSTTTDTPTTTMDSTTTSTMMVSSTTTTTTMMETSTTTTMTPDGPPPPNPMACDMLAIYNCSLNTTCSVYNGTCMVSCYMYAMNDATKCGTWSARCEMGVMGAAAACMPKCSALMNDTMCKNTPMCRWYNGKCRLDCKYANQNQCGMSDLCMWHSEWNMCHPMCDKGSYDDVACALTSSDCEWDQGTKKCVDDCWSYRGSQAMCEAHAHCWFAMKEGTNYCYPKCSMAMTKMDCENRDYGDACQWWNGTCNQKCFYREWTQAGCEAFGLCKFVGNQCTTYKCNWLQPGVMDCDHISNNYACETINNMCSPTCTLTYWTNMTCDASQGCHMDDKGACVAWPCMNYTTEGTCAMRDGCTWTSSSMCRPKCETAASNGTLCGMWAHCMWNAGKCWAKCDMLMSQAACDGAAVDFDKSNCMWDSRNGMCISRCQYTPNGWAGCAARAECKWDMYGGCLPKCSSAANEMQCMSSIYQYRLTCMYDKQNMMCADSCASRMPNMQTWTCAAPCWWSSNFSQCVMAPPPTTTTTTMAPTTTTTTAMVTNATNATTTMMSTTTTTAGTTQQQTTSAGQQTTTQAASTTTAGPAGAPRVVFSITPGANATGNMTAAGFKQALMAKLGLASNQLEVIVASGTLVVTFIGADPQGSFAKATNMTFSELRSLGAATVVSVAPGPAPMGSADDDDIVPIAAGAGAGGFVLLVIIIIIVVKAKGGNDGNQYLQDDKPGDQPMLNLPQNQVGGGYQARPQHDNLL